MSIRKICYLLKILLSFYVMYFLPKSTVSCQRSINQHCKVLHNTCGYGTLTKDNKSCIQWKDSKDFKHRPRTQLVNTSICYTTTRDPWCATQSGWEYCKSITCKKSDLCQLDIKWNATNSSLNIQFPENSSSHGILALNYFQNNTCTIYSICHQCEILKLVKNSHFTSCKAESSVNMTNRTVSIEDLEANTMYKFYLIPVIGSGTIGWVNKLSLWTESSVPRGIRIMNKTSSAITIGWTTGHRSQTRYKLLVNNESARHIITTFSNYYTIPNLRPCSKYCFSIVAVNEIGQESAESFPKVCDNTTAKINPINVLPIVYNPFVSTVIRWQYNNTDQCLVRFRVKYWPIKSKDQYRMMITMNKFMEINDLVRNQAYSVSVRAESIGENGTFTDPKTFFLIPLNVAPDIKNFTIENEINVIKVFYRIDSTHSIKTPIFIIRIIDSHKKCLNSVQFQSSNLVNISFNDSQQKQLKDLHNCRIKSTEKFSESKIFDLTVSFVSKELQMTENLIVECYAINAKGIHKLATFSNRIVCKFNIPIEYVLLLTFGSVSFLLLLATIWFQRHQFKKKEFEKKLNEASAYFKKYSVENNNKLDVMSSREAWMSFGVAPSQTERIVKTSDIIDEFQKMSINSKIQEKTFNLTHKIADLPENFDKNRFINILPFDQTRIILQGNLLESDYINASWIPFVCDNESVEYIASQGPFESTVNDFWTMIWQSNASIIVMLTKIYEGYQQKCEQYWPSVLQGTNEPRDYLDFTVILIEETDKIYFKERTFKLVHKVLRKWRIINHLHFDSWDDFSIPNLNMFESFVQRFHEVTYGFNCAPYVVHCSAGVGRTGTFITIDRIIRKILNGSKTVNIYEEVMELRKYRSYLVQQQTQYIFIHDFAKYFINKYNSKDFDVEIDENIYE